MSKFRIIEVIDCGRVYYKAQKRMSFLKTWINIEGYVSYGLGLGGYTEMFLTQRIAEEVVEKEIKRIDWLKQKPTERIVKNYE